MFRTTVALALALLVVPSISESATAQTTEATRAAVQSFVKAFVDAANKADISTVMEMYSRKAEVTSVGDGEINRGWDAIRKDADEVVGKEGSYKISIGSIDVIPLGPSYVLAVAPLMVTVATGDTAVQLPAAMTLVLEKSGSKWTILHDHMSTKGADQTGD